MNLDHDLRIGLGGLLAVLFLARPLPGGTHQDFDNPGTPYLLCTHAAGPGATTQRDPPGTDLSGRHLRLATAPAPSHNSVIFDPRGPSPACRTDVAIEFDFRLTPLLGQADGLGLSLLRHAQYGQAKCVPPEGPYFSAEEPNFQASLGIGFDIHQNQPQDQSANHVSIHYDGAELAQFPVAGLGLASSDWIHARIRIRGEGQDGRVTVVLKPKGTGGAVAVVSNFLVRDLFPYDWRLRLGARSGGEAAHHDVDNLHVVAAGCPQLDGQWDPAILPFGAVPIHAHMLPTGKVLFWDAPDNHVPHLWNPERPSDAPTPAADPGYHLFCAGHAFRGDGGLFVSGGYIENNNGEVRASTYDPFLNTWTGHPDMNAGRWYPTSTTLADGSVLTVSGDYFDQTGQPARNTLPQVFDPEAGVFRDLPTAHQDLPLYPFMSLAPNRRAFAAGPQPETYYLDTSGTGAWAPVATSSYGHRDYGSAVIYRPGRVMILGGSPPDPFPEPPTNSVETIDLYARRPRWQPLAPMNHARRQHNVTVLPDGTVLVTGGTTTRGFNNSMGAVRAAELWDPATGAWRTLASMQEARLYHSTALLLPDGRVLVGGGGNPPDGDNGDSNHPNAELFSPPYLFRGPRPTIVAAPASVTYGESFLVTTPDAATITEVTWVRLGSVTHAFDQNQRFGPLRFQTAPGGLLVHAPPDADTTPPGHYLLFILRSGVPSIAHIVRIH